MIRNGANEEPVLPGGEVLFETTPSRRITYRRRWYDQGWFWFIVTAVGAAVIGFGVSKLTEFFI